jgi:hypothetical protein
MGYTGQTDQKFFSKLFAAATQDHQTGGRRFTAPKGQIAHAAKPIRVSVFLQVIVVQQCR